jgi:hypothetical protein
MKVKTLPHMTRGGNAPIHAGIAERYARALIELQPDEPGPRRLLDQIRTERQMR